MIDYPDNIPDSGNIEVHLEAPGGLIEPITLYQIAEGLQQITDTLFADFAKDRDTAKVYLRPPKEGCFEAILTIVAVGVLNITLNDFIKSFMNSFIKSMTGKNIEELASHLSDKTVSLLNQSPLIEFISAAVTQYLEEPTNSIKVEKLTKLDYDRTIDLQKGKNGVYESISRDPRISKVSFGGEKIIHRSEFNKYYMELSGTQDKLIDTAFYHGKVKITSPVSFTEQARRKWLGLIYDDQNKTKKEIIFDISDENFKQYVITNNISISVDDYAEMQLFKNSSRSPKWTALRVIRYKGIPVSLPLSPQEFHELGLKAIASYSQLQTSLFD